MIIRDEKLDALKNIIGCRVSTHYNTGGIVIAVAGPLVVATRLPTSMTETVKNAG